MPPSLAMCAFIQPSQHKFSSLAVSYFYQPCVRPIQWWPHKGIIVITIGFHRRHSVLTLQLFCILVFLYPDIILDVSDAPATVPVCALLPLPCRAHRKPCPANKPQLDKLAQLPQCDTFTRDTLPASFILALGQLSI